MKRQEGLTRRNTMDLSRRNFLKGGILLGATTAVGALVACSPQTDTANNEPKSESVSEGAANEFFRSIETFEIEPPAAGDVAFEAEPVPDDAVTQTIDVDVVVCGAGWAGCCAMASAAEGGASVALLQKGPAPLCNGADIAAIGDKIHASEGITIDREAYITDLMLAGNWRVNESVVRRFVYRSGEALDWLADNIGSKIDTPPSVNVYSEKAPGGINWYSTSVNLASCNSLLPLLVDYADSFGKLQLFYNTAACQLIQNDDGRIVGVYGKTEDGGYICFNAAKGVVLATGGYEYNPERQQKCLRPRDRVTYWLNACLGNTGDGHDMGLAVGALEDEYPHCVCGDMSATMGEYFSADALPPVYTIGILHPYLRVNDFGKRFVNEGIPFNFLTSAISSQLNAQCWVMFDGDFKSRISALDDMPWTITEDMMDWFFGSAITGETVDDLASKMDVDAAVLQETLNRYNAMVQAGKDDDFGAPISNMWPVAKAPYYAVREQMLVLCTESGLQVNANSAVISKETKAAIPGLYAVGTCSGSMFHDTYPHHCSGASLGRGLTYGYLVGRVLSGQEEPVA
jgi:hypothetical protein